MNLDKAIELLELNVKLAGRKMPPDTLAALQLGIEALKEIQHLHESQVLHADELLPGETLGEGE